MMRRGHATLAGAFVRGIAPAILALAAAGCEGTAPGRRAPPFTLSNAAGKTVSLSDFRGRAVLLCFWTAGVAPCRLQLGEAAWLQRTREADRLAVLAVVVESGAAPASREAADMGMKGPVLLGTPEVIARYFPDGEVTVPLTLLVDGRGVVRNRFLGYHAGADMAPAVDRELAAIRRKGGARVDDR